MRELSLSDKTARHALAWLAILALWLQGQLAYAATLQEQIDQAIGSFTSGHYANSYWTFEAIDLDFGQEPEFLNPDFQRKILPVRAYSALMAERPTDALVHFNQLLGEHKLRPGVRAFALYNTAIALSQTGTLAQAAQAHRLFQTAFPGTNEAHLSLLQEADLLGEIGEQERAAELLDNFYQSDAPQTLRMQGRLLALQLASNAGQSQRVINILFGTNWTVDTMPDIAVLSFAALEAGDLLLAANKPDEAIRAYRLSLPHDVLIEKQQDRLIATRATVAQQAAFASSIWKSYSAQLIARLERQLDQLKSMDDYTPGLYLRSGQAYLIGARYREASILFRTIAQTETFPKDIRAEAHYRWIIALSEAGKWQLARNTAQEFVRQHPAHNLANTALFLIARAYQNEGRFEEANETLSQLIANFPNDKQAARWHFTRGYNYSILEQQVRARADFETALQNFPKSELATQLELWAGLTYFFERDYENSLSRLKALRDKSKKHSLYPEINYRIANLLYAMREYESALQTAGTLINNYPDHYRYAEALALKGDIFMGLGELVRAAQAFRQVPDDDSQIYDYAVFQAAKIYRALERYDLLREHLNTYIARDDANERPRLSEALYWIGWSLQQESRAEEAFPIFDDALQRFGNDPKARSVESILSAYADLYKRRSESGAIDFDLWLRDERDKSIKNGQLTWFARLTNFTANRQRISGKDGVADATLLSIHRLVPIEKQDVSTLASIGIILAERGFDSANDYFEFILNEYPKRFERAAAFFGKARLASESNRLNECRRWLIRFMEETPTHPLAPDARLLAADILTRQGLYEAAADGLNEILQIKEMRGRPHARAIAALARLEMARENPGRAIPYWQRIYTLYRAYPSLVAEAYWESALLFEQIGDPIAAYNTIVEMLQDPRMQSFDQYQYAREKLPKLEEAAREHRAMAEQKLPKPETEIAQ